MSKYTPGPWTIKEEDGDGACRYTDICKTWILDSEFRSNMAFIQAWYQEDDKNVFEEVRANTRLMAAAPELLEAAMDLFADASDRDEIFDADETMHDDWAALKKAIDKALGVAP